MVIRNSLKVQILSSASLSHSDHIVVKNLGSKFESGLKRNVETGEISFADERR